MSTWAPIVQRFYEAGYYDNDDVKVFVAAKMITPEDYQAITGEVYAA